MGIVLPPKGRKPEFFQAELIKVPDIMAHIYPLSPSTTLAERMGSADARCPKCDDNRWWLLPRAGAAVREGGKAYCECLNCGYQTHL